MAAANSLTVMGGYVLSGVKTSGLAELGEE